MSSPVEWLEEQYDYAPVADRGVGCSRLIIELIDDDEFESVERSNAGACWPEPWPHHDLDFGKVRS